VLDALNSQMRANQVVIKQRAADDAVAAAAKLGERETEVQDLKEQVLRMLTFGWLLPPLANQGTIHSPVVFTTFCCVGFQRGFCGYLCYQCRCTT
jgi:hypothetical protein